MVKRKTQKRAFENFQVQEKQKERQKAHEKRLAEQDKPKAKTVKKAQERSRRIHQPFRDGESVLFVGEGNFSFALAYAQRFPASAKVSIATSYDKREDALKKYADLQEILDKLEEAGLVSLFEVDGQNLAKCKELKKRQKSDSDRFHKVVFNFPHVGLGEKDEQRNIKLNQILLLRFLKSAKPLLKEDAGAVGASKASLGKRKRAQDSDGEEEDLPSDPETEEDDDEPPESAKAAAVKGGSILITLFTCKPYNEWALPSLAKSGGKVGAAILPFPESRDARSSQPRYSVVRSFDFEASLWPGYEHRRTIGHKEGKSSLLDREHAKARTWELALAPEIEND